jgi:hypothetical protein
MTPSLPWKDQMHGMRHGATRWARSPCSRGNTVPHHIGRTSVTEQTDGRAMDARPKHDQRLVPSHQPTPSTSLRVTAVGRGSRRRSRAGQRAERECQAATDPSQPCAPGAGHRCRHRELMASPDSNGGHHDFQTSPNNGSRRGKLCKAREFVGRCPISPISLFGCILGRFRHSRARFCIAT